MSITRSTKCLSLLNNINNNTSLSTNCSHTFLCTGIQVQNYRSVKQPSGEMLNVHLRDSSHSVQTPSSTNRRPQLMGHAGYTLPPGVEKTPQLDHRAGGTRGQPGGWASMGVPPVGGG